jgi:hypothetical protein
MGQVMGPTPIAQRHTHGNVLDLINVYIMLTPSNCLAHYTFNAGIKSLRTILPVEIFYYGF